MQAALFAAFRPSWKDIVKERSQSTQSDDKSSQSKGKRRK